MTSLHQNCRFISATQGVRLQQHPGDTVNTHVIYIVCVCVCVYSSTCGCFRYDDVLLFALECKCTCGLLFLLGQNFCGQCYGALRGSLYVQKPGTGCAYFTQYPGGYDMPCPAGTLFSYKLCTCDHSYNVECLCNHY